MKTKSMSPSVARIFGEFVAGSRYTDFPAAEQWRAKGRLLDAVTCVFAGCGDGAADKLGQPG